MSFSLSEHLYEKVSKSYGDPYDAYYEFPFYLSSKKKLCLISDNRVIRILDTKMISVKWAVACAKHVLHRFEEKYPDDKRPRKTIEAVSKWIKDPSEQNTKACYAANTANTSNDLNFVGSVYSASYFASSVYRARYSTEFAFHVAYHASQNQSLEIKWQRKKFNQIVYEDILVLLVRSQYQRIDNKLVRRIPKELLEYIASFIC